MYSAFLMLFIYYISIFAFIAWKCSYIVLKTTPRLNCYNYHFLPLFWFFGVFLWCFWAAPCFLKCFLSRYLFFSSLFTCSSAFSFGLWVCIISKALVLRWPLRLFYLFILKYYKIYWQILFLNVIMLINITNQRKKREKSREVNTLWQR